jgi:hypothetical protein
LREILLSKSAVNMAAAFGQHRFSIRPLLDRVPFGGNQQTTLQLCTAFPFTL